MLESYIDFDIQYPKNNITFVQSDVLNGESKRFEISSYTFTALYDVYTVQHIQTIFFSPTF